VRKLGLPGHEELAVGAIASGDVCSLNQDIISLYRLSSAALDRVIAREKEELARRERAYRPDQPLDLRDRTVILVDDGLATGASMRAAITAVEGQEPARIVVAVPVAAASTAQDFLGEADEIVCVQTPEEFQAVGQWYEDFSQTTDAEVRALLERATKSPQVAAGSY
jgi:putative phosphoribosyl transferase